MVPFVTYRGSKRRYAGAILDAMNVPADAWFYDFCCGTGAVSLALIARGHDPRKIVMVDAGIWGDVWRAIGNGTFTLAGYDEAQARVPEDLHAVKDYMEALYRAPINPETRLYDFVVLQSATIGGGAIDDGTGHWTRKGGFRRYYYSPIEGHKPVKRLPQQPPIPMLRQRLAAVLAAARGVEGVRCDAASFTRDPAEKSYTYIDPPYRGTSGYAHSLDALAFARAFGGRVWVSETIPLGPNFVAITYDRAANSDRGAGHFTSRTFEDGEYLTCVS